MPKSKHRRKAGEKAVPHPGRGKPGRPLFDNAAVTEEEAGALPPPAPQKDTAGLPLFAATIDKLVRR
jgi:hypothetical protein